MSTKYIILITFLTLSSFAFSQSTFCLSFTNAQVTNGGTKFEFDINILRVGDAFNLGSSNLVFDFNPTGLSTPVLVSHTLPTPTYDLPTVTNPLPNRASFNIFLGSDNNGKLINTTPTLLGRVRFNILNPALMGNMNWLYTGGSTQTIVFNDVFPGVSQLFATNNTNTCLIPLQSPLPLQLLSFNSSVSGKSIDLKWTTTDEQNVSHFDIQRSLNGSNFVSIGDVKANINRINGQYQYNDNDVISGQKYFYRLKMVDFDEKYQYSNIISESISAENANFRVYPNPVSRNMVISVISNADDDNTFKLYDAKNSLIIEKSFSNLLEIDTQGLFPGVYFYTIENKRITDHGKLIIVE